MKLDSHVSNDKYDYTVRSIYFDSIEFKHYFDKVIGEKYRKKIRLRGYDQNPDSVVFFEVKRKYEEPGLKNRFSMNYYDALNLIKERTINTENEDLNKFFFQLMSYNLRPIINVIYDREPYTEIVNTNNNLRITFDKNLRSIAFPKIDELFAKSNIKNSMQDFFILEVKFDKFLPVWVRDLSEILSLTRVSSSKYVICIDTHKSIMTQSRFAYLRAEPI